MTNTNVVILLFKIIGNPKCGKSSIISQFANSSFNKNYKTTIGADFTRKDILIDSPKFKKRYVFLIF